MHKKIIFEEYTHRYARNTVWFFVENKTCWYTASPMFLKSTFINAFAKRIILYNTN